MFIPTVRSLLATYRKRIGCSKNYVDFCIHTRILTLCRLLEEMGEGYLADKLLIQKSAMKRLAL
ncbi:hypothetical protein JW935_10245 [candidate division KSB1 bacterium]|nr:hypothetical protein [candidate division KSB1 bacterium]